jgi:hypothetical protein
MKRTLYLTLSKIPFDVMVTGEKGEEFRKYSKWIESRLIDTETWVSKKYDFIKFVNGYGKDKPYFICKFDGFIQCYMDVKSRKYSNGLIVSGIGKYDFIIYLGEIIEKGNLKN